MIKSIEVIGIRKSIFFSIFPTCLKILFILSVVIVLLNFNLKFNFKIRYSKKINKLSTKILYTTIIKIFFYFLIIMNIVILSTLSELYDSEIAFKIVNQYGNFIEYLTLITLIVFGAYDDIEKEKYTIFNIFFMIVLGTYISMIIENFIIK
ncbi:MAG: hypothetical protein SOR31_03565 [Parvimonas sp.]|uniref:hypothetical protein n=1 Tax=Parvimonas sp. TaxID=1944660 RepID=UPI002A75EE06|nr:hypothetical protein [Parvimonas sp.]MDY3050695.1 hypothetical protein [Parvimonas sp.]